MSTITIEIPDELDPIIEEFCKKEERSKSWLVEKALVEKLEDWCDIRIALKEKTEHEKDPTMKISSENLLKKFSLTKSNVIKKEPSKLKLKIGISCFVLFILLIFLSLLTSMNDILIPLAIISHISGMYFLGTSGYARRNFYYWNNCRNYGPYSFDYSDPIFRIHHRNDNN